MIVDCAEQLLRDATSLRELQALAHQRTAWNTHTNRFAQVRGRIEGVAQFRTWIGGRLDSTASTDPEGAKAMSNAVAALAVALRADPEAVLAGNQLPDVASKAETHAQALELDAHAAWQAYLDGQAWSPASLWAPFEDDDDIGPLVRDAAAQDERRRSLEVLGFPDAGQQEVYERLVVERTALLERLPDPGDDKVREFLVAAASAGGARLEDYSPAIAAWVAEHGLLDRYVITASRSRRDR